MKILLVQPNKTHQIWSGVPDVLNTQDFHLFPPMGLMYLSAALKRFTRHEPEVLDAFQRDMDGEALRQHILRGRPDVVGVYASTQNLYDSMEVVRAAKAADPRIHVLMGGPHTTAFPEEAIALEGVDAIFRGDAEIALGEWLDAMEGGLPLEGIAGFFFKRDGQVVRNPPRPNLQDLDALPFPDRECVDLSRYSTPAQERTRVTTILGSRGCPFQCLYCSCRKDYRERSVRNMVDEIEELVASWGMQEVAVLDDNFNLKPGRLEAFCEEILRRGVRIHWAFKGSCRAMTPPLLALARRAGCYRIHYGVETNSDEGHRALHRRADVASTMQCLRWTRQAGIKSVAYMMIGCPHERSFEDLMKNRRFLRELNPDFVVYSVFSPYPDAPSFQEGVRLGYWPPDAWDGFLRNPTKDYDVPTTWPTIPKPELLRALKVLYRDFYFAPATLWRTLISLRSWAGLKRLLRGGLCLVRLLLLPPTKRSF